MNLELVESSVTLNYVDRNLTATTLKIWQRRVAAEACLETFERQREGNIDKFKYAEEAYYRTAQKVLNSYPNLVPHNLTYEQLCSETLNTKKNPSPLKVTGSKIWRTMWESMNTYIANKMIPMWNMVRPALKDGSIPSGVQNFEPALEKLRRKLFDDEFNSVMLIKKRLEKATTTTTSEMSLDDASSAAADDEINNTSNNNNNKKRGKLIFYYSDIIFYCYYYLLLQLF